MSPLLLNKHPMVIDTWWRPLVHIPSNYRGLQVQPGGTSSPTEIPTGWHWHWPGLTTVRLLSKQDHAYIVGADHSSRSNPMSDEPIVAVTKDMQLVSFQGSALLRINHDDNPNQLARLSNHSVNRFIRPTVRHIIRQLTANLNKSDIQLSSELDAEISQLLQAELRQQSIVLQEWKTTSIQPFQTSFPSKSPAA